MMKIILIMGRLQIHLKSKTPSKAMHCVLSRPVVSDSATPWTIAPQAPLSKGILQARIREWVAMAKAAIKTN